MTKRALWLMGSAAAALALALPVLGQDRPESLLPPGFGDSPEPPARRAEPPSPPARSPDAGRAVRPSPGQPPADAAPPADVAADDAAPSDAETLREDRAQLVDLPTQARRSAAAVGLLGPTDGNMGLSAFSGVNGDYLAKIMRRTKAPLASRWASIVLRRALLSRAATPANISSADWVAERSWLLVRMGEAGSARALIQALDVDQYSPATYRYGMQAALASADPAALCPMTAGVDSANRDTAWTLARGICAAFSGEGSIATAHLDRARSRRGDSSPDVLLAEKVMGAAQDSRRSVTINWDDIHRLDVWRYGMATATGMDIPERLLNKTNIRVRGWRAQAPLLSYTTRLPDAERATAMGIFSSAALVDFYSAAYAEQDPADPGNPLFDLLRSSFVGEDDAARVAAMKNFVTQGNPDASQSYARQIALARAAARILPSDDLAQDMPFLLSAMVSAGLDRKAMRWLPVVNSQSDDLGWGILAVSSQRPLSGTSAARIKDFGSASAQNGDLRARFLFAGLAGLGRIAPRDLPAMAESFRVPITKRTSWTDAMERAVRLRSPGAVAILSAAGLQSRHWADIPPDHLYVIVSAMRRVGLEGEARMIVAEAITQA
ncbi:MAG: hypothetical protein ACKOXK_09125 [Chakrabartia sp.]